MTPSKKPEERELSREGKAVLARLRKARGEGVVVSRSQMKRMAYQLGYTEDNVDELLSQVQDPDA